MGHVSPAPRGDYIVITNLAGPMKTRIVRIGNSRGVRLPKPLIEQAGLPEHVELRVRDGTIVIAAAQAPRAGWEEASRHARHRQEGVLLDPPTPTRFDRGVWTW